MRSKSRARKGGSYAALDRFDVFEILDKAPHVVIVANDHADIVFQNAAARVLASTIETKYGEATINALRNALDAHGIGAQNLGGQNASARRTYPVTTTVSARAFAGDAHIELTIDRLGNGFVLSWSDVTHTRERERIVTAVAGELARTADACIAYADQLSSAVLEVSEQASAVATGSAQLTDSIQEIASSAATAVGNTAAAVRSAQSATDLVAQLSESSDRIGAVSRLISSIAGQTNLLALNATIEAARAGETGKGFAVVAGEVKSLAQRSGEATGDIGAMIHAIQADSIATARALEEIVHAISLMDSEQTTIASAVEEQSMTAADIGARVNAVANAAQSSSTAVTGLRAAARVVAEKSHELGQLV